MWSAATILTIDEMEEEAPDMRRHEYLNALYHSLSGLPETVRRDMMRSYEEHFRIGLESGRSEEEVAAGLGDPVLLAQKLRNSWSGSGAGMMPGTADFRQMRAERRPGCFGLLVSFTLLSLLGLVLIGPWVGAFGCIVGAWAACAGLAIGGIAGFFGSMFSPFLTAFGVVPITGLPLLVCVSGSTAAVSLAVLMAIAGVYVTRWFAHGTVRYFRWNLSVLLGRKV